MCQKVLNKKSIILYIYIVNDSNVELFQYLLFKYLNMMKDITTKDVQNMNKF